MSRHAHQASRAKKVYEAEATLKDEGFFVFRRTSAHGLFHLVAMNQNQVKLIQVSALKKYNKKLVEEELAKVQGFVLDKIVPQAKTELWIWVSHRGWIKFFFDGTGRYTKFEDYGTHHHRMKCNRDDNERRK